jgi:hypothetical protein
MDNLENFLKLVSDEKTDTLQKVKDRIEKRKQMEEKAREKAEEMVMEYINKSLSLNLSHAKQCALISVNEIDKLLISERIFESINFWSEVKKQIELL